MVYPLQYLICLLAPRALLLEFKLTGIKQLISSNYGFNGAF